MLGEDFRDAEAEFLETNALNPASVALLLIEVRELEAHLAEAREVIRCHWGAVYSTGRCGHCQACAYLAKHAEGEGTDE